MVSLQYHAFFFTHSSILRFGTGWGKILLINMEKLWSIKGRIDRRQYFLRNLCAYGIIIIWFFLGLNFFFDEQICLYGVIILYVAYAIFQLIQSIKRAHDCGWSGHVCWLYLTGLLEFIHEDLKIFSILGMGLGVVLLFYPGNKSENEYGEPVK